MNRFNSFTERHFNTITVAMVIATIIIGAGCSAFWTGR